ncbi:MAG: hypothetical protein QOJ27_2273 [Sphingomonadales bacterium]|nr:hypothetical protein [Sphingomonadales bacterium]
MRIAVILALGAFALGSAHAQSRSFAMDHGQYGVGDPHQGPSAHWRSRHGSEAVTCLVRKSNGRRVCHSRERWREIASRMDGGERGKR